MAKREKPAATLFDPNPIDTDYLLRKAHLDLARSVGEISIMISRRTCSAKRLMEIIGAIDDVTIELTKVVEHAAKNRTKAKD